MDLPVSYRVCLGGSETAFGFVSNATDDCGGTDRLKSDMDADGDELLGMVIDLKAQNTRMLGWLKDISRTSGDKGAVMGARQLLKEFAQ